LLGLNPVPGEKNSPDIKDLLGFKNGQLLQSELKNTSLMGLACSTNEVTTA